MIEITKTCIVAFIKEKNSLLVWCREKKKTGYGENVFSKAHNDMLYYYVILLKVD